jgi:hypothetical protein
MTSLGDVALVRDELDAMTAAANVPFEKMKKREQILELRYDLANQMETFFEKGKLTSTFKAPKPIREFVKQLDELKRKAGPELGKAMNAAEEEGDEMRCKLLHRKRCENIEEVCRKTIEATRTATRIAGQVYGALEKAKRHIDGTITDLRKLEKSEMDAIRDVSEAYNRHAVQNALSPKRPGIATGSRPAQDRLVTSLFRLYDDVPRIPSPASEKRKRKKSKKKKAPAKARPSKRVKKDAD